MQRDHHLQKIEAIFQKAQAREAAARNRRFAVMHYLMNNTDYFSVSRMLLRDPLSFSDYKGEGEYMWDFKLEPFTVEIDKIISWLDKNPLPRIPQETSDREIAGIMRMRFVNGDDMDFFDYDKIDDEERLDKYALFAIEQEEEGTSPCGCDDWNYHTVEYFFDNLECTGDLDCVSSKKLQLSVEFQQSKEFVKKIGLKFPQLRGLEFDLRDHFPRELLVRRLQQWKEDAIACAKAVREINTTLKARRFQFLPSSRGDYSFNIVGTIKKLLLNRKPKKSRYTRIPVDPKLSLKEMTALYIMNNGNSCSIDEMLEKIPNDLLDYILSMHQCPICNIYLKNNHCLDCGIIEFRLVAYELADDPDLISYQSLQDEPVRMWIDSFVSQVDEECEKIRGKRIPGTRAERRAKYKKLHESNRQ